MSASAAAQACSGTLTPAGGDAAMADDRAPRGDGSLPDAQAPRDTTEAPDVVDAGPPPIDVDQPVLELDGGIPRPRTGSWAPPGGVEVGAITDHPEGVWRYHAGARAIVARDALGFYAYSAVCSHEGCLLRPPDAQGRAACPCHGSTFDGAGRVEREPASVALRRLAVSLAGGRIFVDPTTRVGDVDRATPPDPDASVTADVQRIDGALFDNGPADAPAPDVDLCAAGRDVGALADFAAGTWTLVTAARVIVARDARGLYAFSALCTHSGCTVDAPNPTTGASRCACHGSEFDGNGAVTRSPAREDLEHYAVAVCAGRVRVDSSRAVGASTRTTAA